MGARGEPPSEAPAGEHAAQRLCCSDPSGDFKSLELDGEGCQEGATVLPPRLKKLLVARAERAKLAPPTVDRANK